MHNILMNSGKILEGEKVDTLVKFIISKFAEEKLSVDEARVVLNHTEELVGEFSLVQNCKSVF